MRPAPTPTLLVLGAVCAVLSTGDTPTKLRIVTPRDRGILATAINNQGVVIGFQWRTNPEDDGVVDEVPFLARGEQIRDLPTLEGYTATFPNDISDSGLVVGRASKPAPLGQRAILRNQAFVWDAERGMRGLGAAEDDWISVATAISRDGSRIVGYTLGQARQRPCVWDRDGEGAEAGWRLTVLPDEAHQVSTRLAISDDGQRVAASDGSIPCLWTHDAAGAWTREPLGDAGAFAPRAVNNAGMVVGLHYTFEGLTHAVVWTRADGLQRLPEPAGYVTSAALDVNNAGVVVGTVDGPRGSTTHPRAFAFEDGQLRILDQAGPSFAQATAINDRGEVAGVFEEPENLEP